MQTPANRPSTVDCQPLTLDIRDLIGAPFAWNARGPCEFDCLGLLLEVQRRLGKHPEDYRADPNDPERNAAIVAAGVGDGWRRIEWPEAGCAVVFKGYEPHVGVMLDAEGDRFLHTTIELKHAVVGHLSRPHFASLVAGFYRYEGK